MNTLQQEALVAERVAHPSSGEQWEGRRDGTRVQVVCGCYGNRIQMVCGGEGTCRWGWDVWFFVAVLFVVLFLLLFTQVCCAWDCLQMGSGIVPASKVRAVAMHTSTDNIQGHHQ